MGKVTVGSAWPLGSSLTPLGVNFSLAAPHATNVELLIFQNENDDYPKQTIILDQKNKLLSAEALVKEFLISKL